MSELKDYLHKLATDPAKVRHRNVAHRAVNLGYAKESKRRDGITYAITDAGKGFIGLLPVVETKEQEDGKVQTVRQDNERQGQQQDDPQHAGRQGKEPQARVLTKPSAKKRK